MPNAQNTRPTISSLCPGMPKKDTLDRSGMRRFASPPAVSPACAASAGAASASALSASNGWKSTRAARRTIGANQFIGKRLQRVRAKHNALQAAAETAATTMIDASATPGNGSRRLRAPPQEKHGYADDDDREPRQRLRPCLVGNEQDDRSNRRQQDVQPRKPRIP